MGGPQISALVRGDQLVVANAGDSRCVLCRKGQAVAMSEDHKPTNAGEHSRITKARLSPVCLACLPPGWGLVAAGLPPGVRRHGAQVRSCCGCIASDSLPMCPRQACRICSECTAGGQLPHRSCRQACNGMHQRTDASQISEY